MSPIEEPITSSRPAFHLSSDRLKADRLLRCLPPGSWWTKELEGKTAYSRGESFGRGASDTAALNHFLRRVLPLAPRLYGWRWFAGARCAHQSCSNLESVPAAGGGNPGGHPPVRGGRAGCRIPSRPSFGSRRSALRGQRDLTCPRLEAASRALVAGALTSAPRRAQPPSSAAACRVGKGVKRHREGDGGKEVRARPSTPIIDVFVDRRVLA